MLKQVACAGFVAFCFVPAAGFAQAIYPSDVVIPGDLTDAPRLQFPLRVFSGDSLPGSSPYQTHTIDITSGGKPFRALVDTAPDQFLDDAAVISPFVQTVGEVPPRLVLRRWSPGLLLYKGDFVLADPLQNLVSQGFGKQTAEVAAGREADGGPLDARLSDDLLVVEDGRYTLVVIPDPRGDEGDNFGAKYILYLDGAVISTGLTTQAQLDELQSLSGFAGRQNLRVLTGNITSALIEGQVTRAANISTQGTAAAPDMFPWFRLSNAKDIGGTNKLSVPAVQFGVDWSVAPNLVAGLSLSGARMEASNPTASLKATQVAVQPYLGWSVGNWRGAASVVLGRIDYESLVTAGGTASAEGDLRAVLLDVARDFSLSPAATLSPFAAVRLGKIDLTQTAGSLAATGIGSEVTFQELTIGATYARDIGPGTARLTLAADHFETNAPINLSAGAFDQTGWSGSFGIGYEAAIGRAVTLNGDAKVTGLGSDSRVGELALTMRWSF